MWRSSDSSITVVGIDIGGTNVDIALADQTGTLLRRARLRTDAHDGPDAVIARTVAAVHRIVDHERARVSAYGAAVAGVVHPDGVRLAPNLPGWEHLRLVERLRDELESPRVYVSNDVQAAALAEVRDGSLSDAGTGLYISLGTGVAAAVTVGGQVLNGVNGAAGEIGYLPVRRGGDSPVPDGSTLEALVGGRAMSERASLVLGRPVDVGGIVASPDPRLQDIWREGLDALSETVVGLALLVDPGVIVLGGGLMAAGDAVLSAVRDAAAAALPFAPRIVAARFTQDASLHGAVLCALEGAREAMSPEFVAATSPPTRPTFLRPS